MNNKYENKLKRNNKRPITKIQERKFENLMKVYNEYEKIIIDDIEYVPYCDLKMLIEGSRATADRTITYYRREGWFTETKIGGKVYLSFAGEPESRPEKEITKSSAILTIAQILADVSNMIDDLDTVIEFYDITDESEYAEVTMLNDMVKETAFNLANRADALGFTIGDEQ
tara:strand:- start:761 stop:1273 length:513 start_codon:yes stop_codon:yes gene_type:complete